LRPRRAGTAEANGRVGDGVPACGRDLDDLPPVVAQVVVDFALEAGDAELDRMDGVARKLRLGIERFDGGFDRLLPGCGLELEKVDATQPFPKPLERRGQVSR
jgi:hypothetical protein